MQCLTLMHQRSKYTPKELHASVHAGLAYLHNAYASPAFLSFDEKHSLESGPRNRTSKAPGFNIWGHELARKLQGRLNTTISVI